MNTKEAQIDNPPSPEKQDVSQESEVLEHRFTEQSYGCLVLQYPPVSTALSPSPEREAVNKQSEVHGLQSNLMCV